MSYEYPNLRFPERLRYGDDVCGPRAAWLVLRQFGIRTTVRRLLRLADYTYENGTYAIGLAVALHELGLAVVFQTDPDPSQAPREPALYARATQLGILIGRPFRTQTLIRHARAGRPSIVLYAREKDAHFAVVRGNDRRRVLLSDSWMDIHRLDQRRASPGCLRQTILVLGRQAAV